MTEQLKLLIQSGNPLISVETANEQRLFNLVGEIARKMSRPCFHWSMTEGMLKYAIYSEQEGTPAPEVILKSDTAVKVLKNILKHPEKGIYVFKDIGPHCKDARVHRLLRDLLFQAEEHKITLIFSDVLPLPEEVKRFTIRFDLGYPDAKELEEVVRETFKRIKKQSLVKVTSNITKREMEQLVQSLRGLSRAEAARIVSAAIHEDYVLDANDLPKIIEGKRHLLSNAGCLESVTADFNTKDIGGLKNLKSWLEQRRSGFTNRARKSGLEPPRGVLMLGVPGCGKSLCAKVVAADWCMPLLRLDPGVLYQKFIGESESQLRQALRQAEAMAPVILWIDEIEKAFASANSSSADGGLSKRMFGTLLSWMQDHRHPIFIVATANDISALPPELMRKGRFDEVFFVDLPSKKARKEILRIHLIRRDQNPENFDLSRLAEKSENFSGSELEQAVISALYTAFNEDKPLNDAHIDAELSSTRPLAVLSQEKVAQLRQWAKNRCVSAD